MDPTRFFLAIALSLLIVFGFDWLAAKLHESRKVSQPSLLTGQVTESSGIEPAAPRVPIEGLRVRGSINLRGARLDDLVLRDYRETTDRRSPLVRLLAPRGNAQPYAVQFGWRLCGNGALLGDFLLGAGANAALHHSRIAAISLGAPIRAITRLIL